MEILEGTYQNTATNSFSLVEYIFRYLDYEGSIDYHSIKNYLDMGRWCLLKKQDGQNSQVVKKGSLGCTFSYHFCADASDFNWYMLCRFKCDYTIFEWQLHLLIDFDY